MMEEGKIGWWNSNFLNTANEVRGKLNDRESEEEGLLLNLTDWDSEDKKLRTDGLG